VIANADALLKPLTAGLSGATEDEPPNMVSPMPPFAFSAW
jgi:hypothetical protein